MALKKILKGLKTSLKSEKEKNPSTLIGGLFNKFKIRCIQNRIEQIETELKYRKTKR